MTIFQSGLATPQTNHTIIFFKSKRINMPAKKKVEAPAADAAPKAVGKGGRGKSTCKIFAKYFRFT